jgi:hypothetical protein
MARLISMLLLARTGSLTVLREMQGGMNDVGWVWVGGVFEQGW